MSYRVGSIQRSYPTAASVPRCGRLPGGPSVPVEVHLNSEARYPPTVEVAAYYVVSEALTNTPGTPRPRGWRWSSTSKTAHCVCPPAMTASVEQTRGADRA